MMMRPGFLPRACRQTPWPQVRDRDSPPRRPRSPGPLVTPGKAPSLWSPGALASAGLAPPSRATLTKAASGHLACCQACQRDRGPPGALGRALQRAREPPLCRACRAAPRLWLMPQGPSSPTNPASPSLCSPLPPSRLPHCPFYQRCYSTTTGFLPMDMSSHPNPPACPSPPTGHGAEFPGRGPWAGLAPALDAPFVSASRFAAPWVPEQPPACPPPPLLPRPPPCLTPVWPHALTPSPPTSRLARPCPVSPTAFSSPSLSDGISRLWSEMPVCSWTP